MTADVGTPCSLQARSVGEQLAGTAPVARTWVVVEQAGPWGRDALADSHLPDDAATWLSAAKARGVGVLLARHPDRPERVGASDHHVWVARSAAGGMRLRHAVLDDLSVVTRWDIDDLAAGQLPAIGSATVDPVTFVCTHSGRDQCCALHGRGLVTALLARTDDQQRARVWECSHIGGHRFAPVTLTLPSGTVHGRIALGDAGDLIARLEGGRVRPELMRGRSCFPEPLQAADVAVRAHEGIDGDDDIDVLLRVNDRAVPVELGWPVPTGSVVLEVRHRDGRAWEVAVAHRTDARRRAESCGGEPQPVHTWQASPPQQLAPWR